MRDVNRIIENCHMKVKPSYPVQDICPDEYCGYGGGGGSRASSKSSKTLWHDLPDELEHSSAPSKRKPAKKQTYVDKIHGVLKAFIGA